MNMFKVDLKHINALMKVVAVLTVFSDGLAFAQEAAPAEETSFAGVFMQMLPVYALVIAVYYLLVLKPQQRKQLAQQQLKESLKKGDSVITSSGIVGKIVGIEDDFYSLEIASNTRIKILASHIVGKPEDAKSGDANTAEKKAVSNS